MVDPKQVRGKTKVLAAVRAIADGAKSTKPASEVKDGTQGNAATPASSTEKEQAAATGKQEVKPDESGGKAKGSAENAQSSPLDVLSKKSFQIRIVQWSADEGGIVKSFIASKDLAQKSLDARTVSLQGFRALIPAASKISQRHKFCSPSGMTIHDETITFEEYIAIEPKGSVDAEPDSEGSLQAMPAVKLFYKADEEGNDPPDHSVSDDIKANMELRDFEQATAKEFVEKVRKSLLAGEKDLLVKSGAGLQSGPGSLTEAQWGLVMRNCSVLYGWYFDRRTRQVIRAPKQAFRLKPVMHTVSVQSAGSESQDDEDSKKGKPEAGKADEEGETEDREGDDADGAEEEDDNDDDDGGRNVAEDDGDAEEEEDAQDGVVVKTKSKKEEDEAEQKPKTSIGSVGMTSLTAVASIPNYRINDDSRIDVMACSHEHELSMAKNDFNSTSVEASASGGFGGFTASVSAGFSTSSESSSKDTRNSFHSIMLAKYLYPRCDLLFDADDLEPTEEFQAAIGKIRSHKNLQDVRKLHSTFGQFFCCKVTLGGRLSSTKVMSEDTAITEQTQKEQFKASVGVSVSTPFGGGSVKAEHQQGSSSATNETNVNKREQQVFEAVGGDTILANNPASWAPTVGDFRFWRIIDRDGLVPMIDLLSAMPEYGDVKTLFIQAVPAIDKFVTLDNNHEAPIRLKVQAPTNGMSSLSQEQVVYFLGHRPGAVANPRLHHIDPEKGHWFMGTYDKSQLTVMFKPAAYRAPAIIGYLDNKVGSAQYGANYTREFLETQWDIVAPFEEALAHGTRVILKTRAYRDPLVKATSVASAPPPTTGASNTTAAAAAPAAAPAPASTVAPPPPTQPDVVSHMIVFRNQQGVFLPAMSDNDEVQYWRILKAESSAEPGSHIQDGDDVRLCWRFEDQTVGYRDFVGDVFGRRQFSPPNDFPHSTLYLKIPWPRFEGITNGSQEPPPMHYMMMTPQDETSAVWYSFKCLQKDGRREQTTHSSVQDLVFRIDKVRNQGYGDSEDYMLRGLRQDQDAKDVADLNIGGRTVRVVQGAKPIPIQHQTMWI